MVINHCWTCLVCVGHLDRHCTGSEIFSRETICLDWIDFSVCSGRTADDPALQLCLVQGRRERRPEELRGENNHSRDLKLWTCRPAPFRLGSLHQVRSERWWHRWLTVIRALHCSFRGHITVAYTKECLHIVIQKCAACLHAQWYGLIECAYRSNRIQPALHHTWKSLEKCTMMNEITNTVCGGSNLFWLCFECVDRYYHLLKKGFKVIWTTTRSSCTVEEQRDEHHYLFCLAADLSMLKLFEAFLESAPQLLLQLYIVLGHECSIVQCKSMPEVR